MIQTILSMHEYILDEVGSAQQHRPVEFLQQNHTKVWILYKFIAQTYFNRNLAKLLYVGLTVN